MSNRPDEPDFLLNRFDEWLRDRPVRPRPDLLARTRQRLRESPADDLDAVIDSLLRPNPALHSPRMLGRVRARLEAARPSPARIPWFEWLAPLAAAATLTLAFVSFQTRAPQLPHSLAGPPPLATAPAGQPDSDLTLIFALATNLNGSASLSSLQSVDDLAFLFE